jgi:lathosterol oxidase
MTLSGFVVVAVAGGLGMQLAIAGFFEWFYYRRRRDRAEAWKCQPRRFAPARVKRRDVLLGAANMVAASVVSGFLAHAIATDNPTQVYFRSAGHGIVFGTALTLAYFALTDGALYWAHRLLHRPALFRAIHRWHHRNTTPTAFTASSMHPVEFAIYQGVVLAPLFFMPVPVEGLVFVLVYQNFVALVDHSGVKLKSHLPWQPPPRFHDDHHVYFHVNYGQTLGMWDRMFGTWRREGRVYGEHVFGGKGAPVSSAGDGAKPRFVNYDGDGSAAAPAPGNEAARP